MWAFLLRELRVEGRSRAHFALRCLGAGTVLAAFLWCWWRLSSGMGRGGEGLFGFLGRVSIAVIWLVGPLLTADCIAREKRQGTLGLLWLTPLRPWEVILAKTVAQSLRASAILAAAAPVFAIPFLLGGVGWPDVLRLVALQFAALGLAMAAGIAASALCRDWWRVRWAALGLNLLLLVTFLVAYQATWALPEWWRMRQAGSDLPIGVFVSKRFQIWGWQLVQGYRFIQLGHLPPYPAASWSMVGRAAVLASWMTLLSLGVGWAAALGLVRALRNEAKGIPTGLRLGRQWRRWGHRAAIWCAVGLGVAYLLGAVVDWPTVDHVRTTGAAAGWVGAILAVAWGATRFRAVRDAGAMEILAVVPGGIEAWFRGDLRSGISRAVVGLVLAVLLAHGVALAAVLSAQLGRYPWTLPPWLLGQAFSVALLAWAGAWTSMAGACRWERPEVAGGVALVLLMAGPWLLEPLAIDLLRGLGPELSGRLADAWAASRKRSMSVGVAAMAWAVKAAWWAALGLAGRITVRRRLRSGAGLQ